MHGTPYGPWVTYSEPLGLERMPRFNRGKRSRQNMPSRFDAVCSHVASHEGTRGKHWGVPSPARTVYAFTRLRDGTGYAGAIPHARPDHGGGSSE